MLSSLPSLSIPLHESEKEKKRKKKERKPNQKEEETSKAKQNHFGVPISSPSSSSSPPPPLLVQYSRFGVPRRRRHEAGRGGAPVAPALRALCAPAHRTPVAGGWGPAAAAAAPGDGGGGGVHATGRVHGTHALRVGDLHAGLLPHALGHRARLRVPLRRLRHQPLRDLEGHPLARRRVLVLAEGGLHMAYIFQAPIHADVKSNTK